MHTVIQGGRRIPNRTEPRYFIYAVEHCSRYEIIKFVQECERHAFMGKVNRGVITFCFYSGWNEMMGFAMTGGYTQMMARGRGGHSVRFHEKKG